MRFGTLLAVIAAGGVLGGCGQGDAREDVRTVTERFYAAVQADDGSVACAQLSRDTRLQLESQEGLDCAEAIGELELDGGSLTRVEVFVTNAKADLSSGETAFLGRTREGWRMSAVGCVPEGGKPADRPYDCEVEA